MIAVGNISYWYGVSNIPLFGNLKMYTTKFQASEECAGSGYVIDVTVCSNLKCE